ncbi:4-(cytidine 5'-diphospho)-2-C-methyl-D-erythritol kinase [Alkalimarinus sediminis]|uniref:4-diphosphocytidyl-2-C-methyl-D-erythritol kinase n=1 Tax=Alkalimarinus sediminis TaxID=1632866 RepID=A0A9E8KPF8_9ALTE|nr:4-(cytidine 5'-diphospho)-2-C-methyl-D-erythritol kinase [Alkalimarinus sediminis]UZW74135.1 4-(cytidine 5'-diphospho)-2-C-methyl-D-erythritol kinase [Alkalimarinus sediminis]
MNGSYPDTTMTQTTITLPAPAKLNLFLHINGRRPDGYHELQTLFQFLDRCDTLQFTVTEEDKIEIAPAIEGVDLQDNLIYKAAMLLKPHRKVTKGIRITLDKVLPMGGGLGGGSSDAATTLVALNTLWQCQQSTAQLMRLGLVLGADVPVFVNGQAAWAEGVGEILTPAKPAEPWYIVVTPNCHVNTGEIFSHQRLTRDTPKLKIAPALEGDVKNYRNDCENIVSELYPEVKQALEALNQFGNSRLTGTGACIFAAFDTKEKAESAFSKLPKSIKGFISKGLNSSPLLC